MGSNNLPQPSKRPYEGGGRHSGGLKRIYGDSGVRWSQKPICRVYSESRNTEIHLCHTYVHITTFLELSRFTTSEFLSLSKLKLWLILRTGGILIRNVNVGWQKDKLHRFVEACRCVPIAYP